MFGLQRIIKTKTTYKNGRRITKIDYLKLDEFKKYVAMKDQQKELEEKKKDLENQLLKQKEEIEKQLEELSIK